MKRNFLTLISAIGAMTLSLSAGAATPPGSSEFPLPNGTKLVTTIEHAKPDSPWLVYIPGSGDHLNNPQKFLPMGFLMKHRELNTLIINKVGVGLDEKVASKETFQRGSLRGQRIADSLTVMKRIVPASAKILLVALSEGAYIAPEIAEKDSRVRALILLSGNTWSWLEEEVNYLPVEKQAPLREFLETEVVPHPVFDKYYQDWTYAYFDSYHTDKTYRSLARSTLPVLALNGEKDDILWLEGALQNLRKLVNVEARTNLEFHLIPGADHLLRCPEKAVGCDKAPIEAEVRRHLGAFVDRLRL